MLFKQNFSSKAKSLIDDLKDRDLIYQCTNEQKLLKNLSNNCSLYIGFDPTANSLHLGNYLGLSIINRFSELGFKTFVVLGHITAQIGDPSFRNKDRPILTAREVAKNKKNIKKQIKKVCKKTKIICNCQIIKDKKNFLNISHLKNFLIKQNLYHLLDKSFLKSKSKVGVTFLEALYPMFQAYDFYWLNKYKNVSIQFGGSDQWGNITTGIELADNENSNLVGFTFPLLLDKNNEKFGKSNKNPLFLDPKLTDPFVVFNYLINTSDENVQKFLKYFSFIQMSEIKDIMKEHNKNKSEKFAQKSFTKDLMNLLYSPKVYQHCENISKKLFSNENQLSKYEFNILKKTLKTIYKNFNDLSVQNILMEIDFCKSIAEAKRLIIQKGVKFNNIIISDINYKFKKQDLINNFILVKKGKKEFSLVQIIS